MYSKKVNNFESIIKFYKASLEKLGYFVPAKSNLKWVINKEYSEDEIEQFINALENIILKIKEEGLIIK